MKLPAIPKAIPSAIPYDLILIRSRVLGQDVAIVRNQFVACPADALKLTWKEAMALVGSGATPADLPRLMRIRAEFSDGPDLARFEPASTVTGFIPRSAPEPPAPAPAAPDTPQLELF